MGFPVLTIHAMRWSWLVLELGSIGLCSCPVQGSECRGCRRRMVIRSTSWSTKSWTGSRVWGDLLIWLLFYDESRMDRVCLL